MPVDFVRLLVPVPTTVAFRSVTYLLRIQKVAGGGAGWRLEAYAPEVGTWHLTDPCETGQVLLGRLYVTGFAGARGTVPGLILARLLATGRAAPALVPTRRK